MEKNVDKKDGFEQEKQGKMFSTATNISKRLFHSVVFKSISDYEWRLCSK